MLAKQANGVGTLIFVNQLILLAISKWHSSNPRPQPLGSTFRITERITTKGAKRMWSERWIADESRVVELRNEGSSRRNVLRNAADAAPLEMLVMGRC